MDLGHADPAHGVFADYRFQQPALLHEALTHRSAASSRGRNKASNSNERLEFVGDRVLGLVMAEWLAERFPAEPEGALGQRLASLVSRPVLADIAARFGLDAHLHVSDGETRAGVRQLATVLADAMEAVLGAIYLDGGLAPVRTLIRGLWQDAVQAQSQPPKDPKSRLQEWLLARGRGLPDYRIASSEGPAHKPRFTVTVSAAGQSASFIAGSKREAERGAAERLMDVLS